MRYWPAFCFNLKGLVTNSGYIVSPSVGGIGNVFNQPIMARHRLYVIVTCSCTMGVHYWYQPSRFFFIIVTINDGIATITWMLRIGSMAKKDWTGNRYCLCEVLSRIFINISNISQIHNTSGVKMQTE